MRCLRCGYRLGPFENECPTCEGRASADASWVCRTCGARNPSGARACDSCGAMHLGREAVASAKLASFTRRLLAQLIDGVVVLLAVGSLALVGLAVSPEWGLEGRELLGLTVDQFVLVAGILLGIVYQTALVALWGATIGKLVLGMQVMRTNGARVGWWDSLLRAVGLFASLATLGIVFLLVVRDRTNQGLHDKLAGTMVVRG